jgi:membrane protein implicated in regulation of membrane protease activity
VFSKFNSFVKSTVKNTVKKIDLFRLPRVYDELTKIIERYNHKLQNPSPYTYNKVGIMMDAPSDEKPKEMDAPSDENPNEMNAYYFYTHLKANSLFSKVLVYFLRVTRIVILIALSVLIGLYAFALAAAMSPLVVPSLIFSVIGVIFTFFIPISLIYGRTFINQTNGPPPTIDPIECFGNHITTATTKNGQKHNIIVKSIKHVPSVPL